MLCDSSLCLLSIFSYLCTQLFLLPCFVFFPCLLHLSIAEKSSFVSVIMPYRNHTFIIIIIIIRFFCNGGAYLYLAALPFFLYKESAIQVGEQGKACCQTGIDTAKAGRLCTPPTLISAIAYTANGARAAPSHRPSRAHTHAHAYSLCLLSAINRYTRCSSCVPCQHHRV